MDPGVVIIHKIYAPQMSETKRPLQATLEKRDANKKKKRKRRERKGERGKPTEERKRKGEIENYTSSGYVINDDFTPTT